MSMIKYKRLALKGGRIGLEEKKGALGPRLHSAEAKLRGPMLGLTPVQDLEFRLWVL